MQKTDLKYLLKIIFSIVLITFVVDKAIYLVLNNISGKVFSGQSIGKVNQYLKINNDCDLIIFGSSRANHHLNPDSLSDNGFNMGVDGSKIAYANSLIKLLPTDKPQTIIVHIDPSKCCDQTYKGSDIQKLKSFYNQNNIIKQEFNKINQQNYIQLFYYCIGYNSKVLGILKNYFRPNYDYRKYNGYDPLKMSGQSQETMNKILKTKSVTQCNETPKISTIYKNYIEGISSFCNDNNKRLVFFTSPIYSDHCIKDNNVVAKFMSKLGVHYYDLTNFYNKNNKYIYWKDKSHLTDEGAKLVSSSMAKTIRSLSN